MCRIEQLVATCERACRAGALRLMEMKSCFTAEEKSARDFVTNADIASQEAVRKTILEAFPDHGFLGEESPDTAQLEKTYCWVVDPLDGTTNYLHGFPYFAVSVAVAKQGRPVAGGVFDPLRAEMFLAASGIGATLNGQTIHASTTETLESSLVAVSFPPRMTLEMPDVQAFLKAAPLSRAVRRIGSAALNLAYVACGRLDAHWAFEIFPWDGAAGMILVEQAGGVATSATGESYDLQKGDYLVASTDKLHQQLQDTFNA